jgi:hypothetical protein
VILTTGMALLALAQAAGQPSPPSPPSPPMVAATDEIGRLAAARDLLRATDFEGQMELSAQQSAHATFETLLAAEEKRRGTPMPDDLRRAVRAVLDDHMSVLVADLKRTGLDDAARVYARYFTADELRELLRLQSNPVMKKAQAIGPLLLSDLMQIGVRASAQRQPALEAELKRVVREWLASHPGSPRSS